ncbi:MAG: Holliday junction resolvase RuvX [Verrucomicrobiota bacterium]
MSGTRATSPILGIDYGQVRIGVAISDELLFLAHPLETIPANKEAVARINEIVREKGCSQVVVGIPRQMSGEIGIAAKEALEFAEKLRQSLPCEIVTWDERLTTVAAHRALREAGKKTRETRSYVDQVAAQMILQGHLDRRQDAAGAEEPSR